MKDFFELRNQVLGPDHPNTKTSLEPLRKRESKDKTVTMARFKQLIRRKTGVVQ